MARSDVQRGSHKPDPEVDPLLAAKIAELDARYDAERAEIEQTHVVQLYPAWRYHASQPPRLVNSEEEAKALDSEWVESPVNQNTPEAKAKRIAELKKKHDEEIAAIEAESA